MASVSLRGIKKQYDSTSVIKGVDLDIEDGQFVVFVGPSGCGKSTLLRIIAGLEDITEGTLEIGGVRSNDVEPSKRGIAMVFQSYALYPHMTVAENMGFALKLAGMPKGEIAARVGSAAQILQIGELLGRKPKALSGGQRQRVAIGRAIVREPQVFLFDEPLSNLDAALRVQMRIELGRLHKSLKTTMIYVTHDQVEAMTMGDQIVVFNDGYIEQAGTPMALYERPANRFVAGFLGSPRMNFVDATIASAGVDGVNLLLPGGQRIDVAASGEARLAGQGATLGIRPEHITLGLAGDANSVPAKVALVEHLGDAMIVYAQMAGVAEVVSVKLSVELARPQVGQVIALVVSRTRAFVFGEDGKPLALLALARQAAEAKFQA
jgi:multiple sugar transport system ATP-binding protein